MPPKPTQACRAVHRRLQIQRDRFGISEAALAAVFEQYAAISNTQTRNASLAPGPLENRRRVGKRQMGELSFGQTAGAASPWELETCVDLTQFRWRPPSSSARRISQQLHTAQHGIIKSAVATALSPVRAVRDAAAALIHPVALDLYRSDVMPLDYVDAGFAQLSYDLSRDWTLKKAPKFFNFCQALEERIASGNLQGPNVTLVFTNLHQGICALAANALEETQRVGVGHNLIIALVKSVSRGTAACKDVVKDQQLFRELLLATTMIQVKNPEPVLSTVTACIPEGQVAKVSHELAANLLPFFDSMKGMNEGTDFMRQINKFVPIWKSLSSSNHLDLLNKATTIVLTFLAKGQPETDFIRVRYAWLSLLARLPHVSTDYLGQVCAVTESGRHTPAIEGRSLCRLLVTHLGRAGSESMKTFLSRFKARRADHIRLLGLHLGDTGDISSLITAMRFLEQAGRDQDVKALLQAAKDGMPGGDNSSSILVPFLTLALECEDLPMATRLFQSFIHNQVNFEDRFWKSAASVKMLTEVLEKSKSNFPMGRIFQILQLDQFHSVSEGLTSVETQVQKASRLAQAVLMTSERSSRAAFDTVYRCVSFVKKHRQPVPHTILHAVHNQLKKELSAGKVGVQFRLQWYLDLVGEKSGPIKKAQTAERLLAWVEFNREQKKSTLLEEEDSGHGSRIRDLEEDLEQIFTHKINTAKHDV